MHPGGKHKSLIVSSDLGVLAEKHRAAYQSATPWPHLVLDDLVDPERVAAAETQEINRALGLEIQKVQGIVKAESPDVSGKAASEILDALLTAEFIEFLERLTGLADLIGDPSHSRAGLHVSPPGAFQALHRDFRRHPTTGQYHRINVLVFLNSDWKEEYRGELELWPPKASGPEQMKRIRPEAGRVVIFETTPTSYHGIPEPVNCPPGRARLSLASYYYTEQPGPQDRKDMKVFVPRRPQDPARLDVQKFKDLVNSVRDRRRSQ
jgi:Rps23 Pro-64 3,4-dihydroxylase Tpa1-like proline 4-hydroxylase